MKRTLFFIGILLVIIAGVWFAVQNHIFQSSVISPLGGIIRPKPLIKYTIENLSRRTFVPGSVMFDEVTATTSSYTVYSFHYFTDNMKVTGVAHVPNTATPTNRRPVIIQFRGYVDPTQYVPGEGTQHSAEVFAQNGFISLAPDFLGYGGSASPSADVFEDRFETYTTALNLIASVGSIPFADANRVGIWGHSNGGQIALTVLEIIGKPFPAVLWAPVSKPFPYSILYYTDESEDHGKLLRRKLAAFEKNYDVELYSLPNYLNNILGSLQIQQGTADGEVPQKWSDDLVAALKTDGKDVTYFVYPGADHNMTGSWNTVVSRDVEFFQAHLK